MEPARALFSEQPKLGMRALLESSQWLDGPGTTHAALLLAEISAAHPALRDDLDEAFEDSGIPASMRFALTRPRVFLKRNGAQASLPVPATSVPGPVALVVEGSTAPPPQIQAPAPPVVLEGPAPEPEPEPVKTDDLEETPFVRRESRIDLVPKDFSLIDPAPLDALLDSWLNEASLALQELLDLGRQRQLAQELGGLLARSDRNTRAGTKALWTWAGDALATAPPKPLREILQEYKQSLMLVIQGHYDGDYGRDGGIGHLALGEFIPWVTAILALPQDRVTHLWDSTRAAHIEKEWELARDV
ncbi:MAG: hypothetical protein ACI9VR_003260 [Cognaticolwellia sp.]|jgi:hypothetical protein